MTCGVKVKNTIRPMGKPSQFQGIFAELIMPRSVLICEDHQLVVDGLMLCFAESPDYLVVGHARSAGECLAKIKELKPDLLLLDLNLSHSDGFEVLASGRTQHPAMLILILTMYKDEFIIAKAKKMGANGFLEKHVGNQELLSALKNLSHSSFYLSKELLTEEEKRKQYRDFFAGRLRLTRREIEIVTLLVSGNTVNQIAEMLYLSPLTVETHRKNIFKKLGINNVIDLVHFAHANNIC